METQIRDLVFTLLLVSATLAMAQPQPTTLPSTQPIDTTGLVMRLYKLPKVPRTFRTPLPGQMPDFVSILNNIDIHSAAQLRGVAENFQAEITGKLAVVDEGTCLFSLEADFLAEVSLDGKPLVRDQWTPDRPGPTTQAIALNRGEHALGIRFIQDDGGLCCTLKWKPPGADDFQSIPESQLRFDRSDYNRAVSPASQPAGDARYAHRSIFSTRGFSSLTDEEADLLVELLEGPTTLSDSARRDLANLLPACNYEKLPYWHQAKVLSGFIHCWYSGQTFRKVTGQPARFTLGPTEAIDDYSGWAGKPRGKYFKTVAKFADNDVTIFTPKADSPERNDVPAAIATLPGNLRRLLKNVRVEPPGNEHEFNGGGTDIWIRVPKPPARAVLEDVFSHEIGHLLMHKTGCHDRWQAQSAKDILSTSEYGRRNPTEDFADFCRLYIGSMDDPASLESLRKLFPHRMMVFEEVFNQVK